MKPVVANPNDNQGARLMIGEDLHHLGHLDEAIAAYRKATDEPGCCYSLALALLEAGRDGKEVGLAFVRAFAANRYIAFILLGEPWRVLDGFHGSNMAEAEWADDYVKRATGLWLRAPGSARELRRWHEAAPVRAWREQLDELIVRLQADRMPPSDERMRLVSQKFGLCEERALRALVQRVIKQR